jgi:hypothetical protein
LEEVEVSTRNNSVAVEPDSVSEFIQTADEGALHLVNACGHDGPLMMRQKLARRPSRFSASFRECWRKMSVMHAAFEHAESGDGAGSRGHNEERLRDEEAWSRMDDEGCPNGLQPPYSRQDVIGREVEGSSIL